MKNGVQVAAIIPALNEEEAIERVLDELVEVLSAESIRYEILVVDDGSTDHTAQLVEEYAANCWQCPIRLVRMPEQRGAGAARKVGIRHAAELLLEPGRVHPGVPDVQPRHRREPPHRLAVRLGDLEQVGPALPRGEAA